MMLRVEQGRYGGRAGAEGDGERECLKCRRGDFFQERERRLRGARLKGERSDAGLDGVHPRVHPLKELGKPGRAASVMGWSAIRGKKRMCVCNVKGERYETAVTRQCGMLL